MEQQLPPTGTVAQIRQTSDSRSRRRFRLFSVILGVVLLLYLLIAYLAFEQPVGNSPRQRHHVRFWRWDRLESGHEVWFGAATYDTSVGLSHTTGQVTHHIGPDLDKERDRILSQLKEVGQTTEVDWLPGFHTQLQGKNGGGDPWHTDGQLGVATLATPTNASTAMPRVVSHK